MSEGNGRPLELNNLVLRGLRRQPVELGAFCIGAFLVSAFEAGVCRIMGQTLPWQSI
jgi:hypothetical protein